MENPCCSCKLNTAKLTRWSNLAQDALVELEAESSSVAPVLAGGEVGHRLLPRVFPLPPWLRHRLCLVLPLPP